MIIPPGGERNSDLLEDEIWPQTPLSSVTGCLPEPVQPCHEYLSWAAKRDLNLL